MLDTRIERYYTDFKIFKENFVRNCLVDKKYESYKVWAQWLIRNLSQIQHNFHLIPPEKFVSNDTDIFQHLQEKGIKPEQIQRFYANVKDNISKLYHTYHQVKFDFLHKPGDIRELNQQIDYELVYHKGKQVHLYRLGRVFVKYNSHIYDRLVKRYLGDPHCFKFYMFEMGFNYYMLEGQSFQWCIPPQSLQILEKTLAVNTELFASPSNALVPNYYSLFYVDRYFGASGNFFNIDPTSILMGTYEVNPPFIEQLFIESSKIICNMLQISQQTNQDLLFIYIMPDWLDSGGYQYMVNSGYLIEEIVLKHNEHYYFHSMKNRLISANFETHVLIVGTRKAKERWTEPVKTQFIKCFQGN